MKDPNHGGSHSIKTTSNGNTERLDLYTLALEAANLQDLGILVEPVEEVPAVSSHSDLQKAA